MKDIFIPLGLLGFIILFGYAIVHTARKQKKAKAGVFKEFADKHDLDYRVEDDGTARAFAGDFDGIGQFYSPSRGKIIPKDVVGGALDGWEMVLFRHNIRFSEGWAREWFVAGVTGERIIAERCAVQFCRKSAQKQTMYLPDPVVKEKAFGPYTMVVRAKSESRAGRMVYDEVLKRLSGLADKLPFRPEIQVRGERVAAYLADRNAGADDVETLEKLAAFTRDAAGLAKGE